MFLFCEAGFTQQLQHSWVPTDTSCMLLQRPRRWIREQLDSLVEFWWPPTCLGCGCVLAAHPADDVFVCTGCRFDLSPLPPEFEFESGIWATQGYDGPVARAARGLKFHGRTELAGSLALLLAQSRVWDGNWTAVVPVPLHRVRLLRRGYNQAELLARWAVRQLRKRGHNIALAPRLLRRTRATLPQTEIAARDRFSNVNGAFDVPKRHAQLVQNARIVVVDDVTTTGATLQACRQALEQAGAAATCGLALARALP